MDFFRQFPGKKFPFRYANEVIGTARLSTGTRWNNNGGNSEVSVGDETFAKFLKVIDRFEFFHESIPFLNCTNSLSGYTKATSSSQKLEPFRSNMCSLQPRREQI